MVQDFYVRKEKALKIIDKMLEEGKDPLVIEYVLMRETGLGMQLIKKRIAQLKALKELKEGEGKNGG